MTTMLEYEIHQVKIEHDERMEAFQEKYGTTDLLVLNRQVSDALASVQVHAASKLQAYRGRKRGGWNELINLFKYDSPAKIESDMRKYRKAKYAWYEEALKEFYAMRHLLVDIVEMEHELAIQKQG